MKKTLTALLAFSSIAFGLNEEFTTTISKGTNGAGNYYGSCFALTHDSLATNDVPFTESTVLLDAVTFTAASSGSSGTVKLAVYKHEGDSKTGTFVGLSSNSVTWSAGTALTFNFDGQEITTSDKYQYLFVSANATADDVDTFAEYKEQAVTMRIAVGNQGAALPSGWGTYTNNTINGWEGAYLTKALVETHITKDDPVVPEPATGSLSLLALAGLCARRRRK